MLKEQEIDMGNEDLNKMDLDLPDRRFTEMEKAQN